MRAPSRIFFAKPASLAWIVCCLCVVAFHAAAAKPRGAASLYAIHSSPRKRRSNAAHKSAAQQRLPGQTSPKFGAVQGLVRGANGRPVLGATVILRNVVTGQSLEKISNAQGVFRFIDVSPGTYDLNVVATGFKDFTNPGLQLKAGDSPVCEVTLIAIPSIGRSSAEVSAARQLAPQIRRRALNPSPLPTLRPPRLRTRLSNRRVSRLRNSQCHQSQRYFNRNPTAGPLPCPIGTAMALAASTRT